jgi:hypothetical protein
MANFYITTSLFTVPRMICKLGDERLFSRPIQSLYDAGSHLMQTSRKISFIVIALRDNLWLAFGLVQGFGEYNSHTLLTGISIMHALPGLFVMSSLLFLIRVVLSRLFPAVAQYIGPSDYPV